MTACLGADELRTWAGAASAAVSCEGPSPVHLSGDWTAGGDAVREAPRPLTRSRNTRPCRPLGSSHPNSGSAHGVG